MAERVLESLPTIPWLALLTKRGRRLADGDALPRLETVVERPGSAAVDAYARVCGLPLGEHLPLCWPHVLAGPLHLEMLAQRAFPLAALGMVHVAQRVVQRRAIGREEPFRLRAAWEGWSRVKRGAEIRLSTRLEVGEEVPWEGESVFLSRAVRGAGEATRQDPGPLGPLVRSTIWRAPADQGRRYAAVSGDWNPIHVTALSARLFGFPRAIAHGMWVLARALAELDPAPGPAALDVVFRRPVLLPSAVLLEQDARGELVVRSPRDGKIHLHGRLVEG